MSFELVLAAAIRSIGMPVPSTGERREDAWPKIITAFDKLIAVASAADALSAACELAKEEIDLTPEQGETLVLLQAELSGLTL